MNEKVLDLKVIDENLLYKVLSIPSFVKQEYRVVEYLYEYAKSHSIKFDMDDKGNVYLCKGVPPENGFYPCVTAHMDTVHNSHVPYIEADKPIPLATYIIENKHMIYAEGMGLGGDDKAGIVIALTMMEKLPVLKAVFFVEEECGCCGSENAELSWFKDVGYIIGFDSPGGNCATWSFSGVNLFDRKFYETFLVELAEKFGLTNFVQHPYSDTLLLRIKTGLTCLNLGAGYYEYHTPHEYCIAEEMDHAASMGIYLVERLGYNEYVNSYSPECFSSKDPDYEYFCQLFDERGALKESPLPCQIRIS